VVPPVNPLKSKKKRKYKLSHRVHRVEESSQRRELIVFREKSLRTESTELRRVHREEN